MFLSGIVFSFGGLAFRLTDDIGAWQYVLFRGLGAFSVAALILTLRNRGRLRAFVVSLRPLHVVLGLLLASMSAMFIVLLEFATVAFILFLQALSPLAAAWFSWLWLRERVSGAAVVATIVALVGVGVMVSATVADDVSPLSLLALSFPVLFGLYATVLRLAPDTSPQVPVLLGGLMMVVVGFGVAATTTGLDVLPRDAAIAFFAGSALLGLPVMLMNRGAVAVPAPETSLLLMGEVIAAPAWVWLFVDERPATRTLFGGVILLSAVLGLLLWRRSQIPKAARPVAV